MPIVFQCPCNQPLQAPEALAGKKVKCPRCGAIAEVPVPVVAVTESIAASPRGVPSPPSEIVAKADDGPPVLPDVDHSGQWLPRDADFFAAPPREIGRCLSAHTSLRLHHQPWPTWKFAVFVVLGTAVGLLLSIAAIYGFGISWWLWKSLVVVFGLLLGLMVGGAIASFSHWATFVGQLGVAKIECSDERTKLGAPQVFLFEDAASLWASIIHYSKLGVYGSTKWSFDWKDAAGKSIYRLSGTHYDGVEGPKASSDDYWLGLSAARAWDRRLHARVIDAFSKGQPLRFPLAKDTHWIEVRQEGLTFSLGKEPETWLLDDIAAIEETENDLRFKHRNMKEGVFSSQGLHVFKPSEIGNQGTLTMLLRHAFAGRFVTKEG